MSLIAHLGKHCMTILLGCLKMTKAEALKLIVESKATSPSTRNFVSWLYENGHMIITPDELEKINGMTVMAHVHGMNPFEKND